MYADVSKDFVTEIEKPSRKFKARIKINGKWYTDIKSLSMASGSCDEDNITIGSAVSSYIEVTMSDMGELFENTEIELQYGIVISDGSIEYIPMGYFTAQRPEDDNGYIKFTAYDRMAKLEKMYTSELAYPATAIQVIDEICSQCGITRETTGLGTVYVQTKPEGYTCREIIGYMASLFGKFAVIGRNGKLQIRFYEDSGYNVQMCRTFSLKKNQSDYAVGFLTCNKDGGTQLITGSGSRGVTFDNPFITQERLEKLYGILEGFTYRPATIKFLGDIRIDAWDLITTTDLTGNVYKIPVMKITQEFDGGVVTTIEASGKTEEEINTDFKGPVTKGLERTYTELLLANTIIATKVDAEWVKANTVTADKIEAVSADIANIHANMLTTNEADIKYATIASLEAEKARITVLEARSADIGILKTQVADINTLMFGTASGGSLTTEFSNTVVGLIGDAQIKSAMIKYITADKITSGKLYTNLVEVVSQSGNLDIADNTIQIRDDEQTARVQIGKDAAGDYNIYIWDKNGKLMFDPLYGIQEDGIKSAVIRNDMISENANISAKKLDISSLITEINGSTETIKANRIYVDADNQTLDVAFKTMSTSVNSLAENVSTQGTQLTTVQGQISSKIWQQDITTAVTELEIGGRNLLKGTHSEPANYSYPESSYDDKFNCVTTVPLNGGIYTLSFWAKSTVDGDKITTYFYNPSNVISVKGSQGQSNANLDGNCEFTLTTTLSKYWVTYTIPKGGNSTRNVMIPRMFRDKGSGTVTIQWEKLDEGNKATDWTPAPEDVDSSLTALEGTTTTLTNQYTEVKQTLSGLSASVAANKTTIATKADGSVVTELQSDVTNIKADIGGFKSEVSSTYSTKAELNSLDGKFDNYSTTTQMNSAIEQKAGKILLEVSGTYATQGSLGNYATTQSVTASLALKIDKTDNNQIISMINASADVIRLTADRFILDSTYSKINQDGTVQFTGGNIGGFTIDGNGLFNVQNGVGCGMQKYGQGSAFWAGAGGVGNGGESAEFKVWHDGSVFAQKMYITGGSLNINNNFIVDTNGNIISNGKAEIANYSTTTQMNSAIEQKAGKILLEVSGTYATQDSLGNYATTQSVTAGLALKIDKTDNNQIISMINASADIIRLTADRFILDSTYSKINQDGTVQFTGGNIGGFAIDGNGLFTVQNGVGAGMQKFGQGSAFWAGAGGVGNGGEDAEFKVWHDGSVFAQKMYITGGSLNINDNLIIDTSGNLISKGSADFQCSTVYSNDFHSRGSMYIENSLDVGGTTGCNTLLVKDNMYVSNVFYYWYDGAWVTLRDYISAIINGG